MMISPFYVLFLSPPGYNALPTHDDGERMDMPPKLKWVLASLLPTKNPCADYLLPI